MTPGSAAKPPPDSCALGFAPHSGWAAVVVIGGTQALPRLLARERLELADPRLAGSRQPYHAVEGLPLAAARAQLAGLEDSATRLAAAGIGTLMQAAREAGSEPVAAGILDASGRQPAALEAILASHALIHAADGNHFRAALERACALQKLACQRIRQRDLVAEGAKTLRRTPDELTRAVARLGRAVGPPWGADQKGAALIAWLLLARAASMSPGASASG